MKTGAEAKQLSLRFVLRYSGFNLDLATTLPGRGVTAIFGKSGSGKTSLLRCIAGLEKAEAGELRVNDEVWQKNNFFLPPHKRSLGYVFQEASLFPHLSARGNLEYAIKRADCEFDHGFYQRVLTTLGIEALLSRYPAQLSGGERQRVAIARALLIRPRLLLMDEPLASLDSARKREILPYLENLHAWLDLPILYVSHAMDEVSRLADTIVVLDQGKIVAQGELNAISSRIDLFQEFTEDTGVILKAEVVERDTRWHLVRVTFDGGELWLRDAGYQLHQPVRVRVLAKDISVALNKHEDTSILNRLSAEITDIGEDEDEAMALLRLRVGAEFLIARITRRSLEHLQLERGHHIYAQIKSAAMVR